MQDETVLRRNVEFTGTAWKVGLRPDKRAPTQAREIYVEFPLLSRDVVQVRCGDTNVVAKVTCELVEPNPFRPKHGFFSFQCKQIFHEKDSLLKQKELKKLNSFLERLFKDNVMETEGLCVIPGRRVWSVLVSVNILNDDGNVRDVAQWAVLSALRSFRRPQVTISGDEIVVHPPHERDPTPLALHHFPVCSTYAITFSPQELELGSRASSLLKKGHVYENALRFVVDPTAVEILASASLLSMAVNAEGMICALERTEGCDISYSLIDECIVIASKMSKYIIQLGEEALQAQEVRIKDALKGQFLWAQERLGVGKSNDETTPDEPENLTKRVKTE